MMLGQAQTIFDKFANLLAANNDIGPAYPISRLPDKKDEIIRAVKYVLAIHRKERFYSKQHEDMAILAISRLTRYIDDEDAKQINAAYHCKLAEAATLSPDEFRAFSEATNAAFQWCIQADIDGYNLSCTVRDFLDTLIQFKSGDIAYWSKLDELLGIQHPKEKKHSFWNWFS
jgi:hypothetical protein